jgi:hypothetical protein
VNGTRRHIAVDTIGLLLTVLVTAEHLSGLRLAIVKRSDKPGFVVIPRRWVVERTLGWITRRRRCVRDYERRPTPTRRWSAGRWPP